MIQKRGYLGREAAVARVCAQRMITRVLGNVFPVPGSVMCPERNITEPGTGSLPGPGLALWTRPIAGQPVRLWHAGGMEAGLPGSEREKPPGLRRLPKQPRRRLR